MGEARMPRRSERRQQKRIEETRDPDEKKSSGEEEEDDNPQLSPGGEVSAHLPEGENWSSLERLLECGGEDMCSDMVLALAENGPICGTEGSQSPAELPSSIPLASSPPPPPPPRENSTPNSTSSSGSRRVHFAGMEDEVEEDTFNKKPAPLVISVDHATREQLLNHIDSLQQRLTETQVELATERSLRKRKQKTLLKLAKELGKRQVDQQRQQAQILKLTDQLSESQAALLESNSVRDSLRQSLQVSLKLIAERSQPTEEPALQQQRSSEHDLQVEAILSEDDGEEKKEEDSSSDEEEEVQKKSESFASSNSHEANEGSAVSTSLSFDRAPAEEEKKEDESPLYLRNNNAEKEHVELSSSCSTTPPQSPPVETREIPAAAMIAEAAACTFTPDLSDCPKPVHKNMSATVLGLAAAFAWAVLAGTHPELFVLSLNGWCAPAMPGTVLRSDDQSQNWVAPWWIASPHKASAFGAVCGPNRARTQLTVQATAQNKQQRTLALTDAQTDTSEMADLFQKWEKDNADRIISMVQVQAESVIVFHSNHTGNAARQEVLPAPWAI